MNTKRLIFTALTLIAVIALPTLVSCEKNSDEQDLTEKNISEKFNSYVEAKDTTTYKILIPTEETKELKELKDRFNNASSG